MMNTANVGPVSLNPMTDLDIEITERPAEPFYPGGFTVTVYARRMGLDRVQTHAWGVGPKRALADRLVRAIRAGVILTDYKVCRDVNGHTYLSSTCTILSRIMHAELKRKGF